MQDYIVENKDTTVNCLMFDATFRLLLGLGFFSSPLGQDLIMPAKKKKKKPPPEEVAPSGVYDYDW